MPKISKILTACGISLVSATAVTTGVFLLHRTPSALAQVAPSPGAPAPSDGSRVIKPKVDIDRVNRLAHVTWAPVPDAIGYLVVYQVELAPQAMTIPQFVVVPPGQEATFRVGELGPQQKYHFGVAPVGAPSEDIEIAAMTDAPAASALETRVGTVPENSMTPTVYFAETNPVAHMGNLSFTWRAAAFATKYRVDYQSRLTEATEWPAAFHSETMNKEQMSFVLREIRLQPYRFRVTPLGPKDVPGPTTEWYGSGH